MKIVKTKKCSGCGKRKLISEFYKDRRAKGGLRCYCKSCTKKQDRVQRKKKKPGLKKILGHAESHRTVRGLSEKLCSRCLTWLSLDKYGADLRHRDGKQSHCRNCMNKYQQTHKAEIAKQYKEYCQTIEGRLRRILNIMNQRCNNSKNIGYKNYGGRGIKCLFKNANELINHVTVDLDLTYDDIKGLQIDRIENDGHYEPGNIRFVTAKVNSNNRRNSRRK